MEHNLELGRGMVESGRCDPPRGVQADRPLKILKTGILETGFLRFGHKNLVAVLVTLQDLVALWSRNAISNCICNEK